MNLPAPGPGYDRLNEAAARAAIEREDLNNVKKAILDYDPHDWVPADGSGAALTFTGVAARGTKIGRDVFIELVLTFPVTADVSNAVISGLKYANNATVYAFHRCRDNAGTTVGVVTSLNAQTLTLVNSNMVQITNAQMSGQALVATFHYSV